MTMTMAGGTITADDVALEWLYQLYRSVDQGWLTLFSVDRGTGARNVDWAPIDRLDELAATAVDRSESCCVWFGVATRSERLGDNNRGGASDCAQLTALWVDIDVAGPNHADNERLPRSLEEASSLVERFGAPPTAIVATGGGLQAWWMLAEPLEADVASPLLARWAATWQHHAEAAGVHVDSVFDLARVMRMPGTQNRKHEPTPVVITDANWERRYGLDDLEPWLRDVPTRVESNRAPYIGPDRPGDAYNVRHSGAEVLSELGFTFARRDRNGDEHWVRAGKEARDGTSATLYAEDGHVTVWSDTVAAQWPALDVRRPYDPFGLLVATSYGGDFARATSELRARGYGGDPTPDLSWIPTSTTDSDEIVVREQDWRDRLVDGRTWLTTGTEAPEAIWGDEHTLLWPMKQPLVIAGPQGAGKTVFGERLCLGFIGIGEPELLGLPLVSREDTKALYLASDRPDQARLSMRRMVHEDDYDHLAERLVVWPGPPPADIAKNPDLLLAMAVEAGARLVVIDSLKDIALKLSDDDVGSAVNRAIQLCIAKEIDVIALHHPRKLGGTDKNDRPRSLDDIYGSYWLTAGAGSVLYIHPGEADTFSLLQFKTPVGEKAELMFKHNHAGGTVLAVEPIDVLTIVEAAGYEGITVEHIAMHLYVVDKPEAKQRKAVIRKLNELAQEDLVEKIGGTTRGVATLWRSTSA